MIALRGTPEDFDRWVELGNDRWSFEDVLPWYCRLETDLDFGDQPFHGDSGPIPVRRIPPDDWMPLSHAFHEACLGLGYASHPDQNAPGSTGISPRPFNNRDGVRVSTSIAYLGRAFGRPNLTVWPDTFVLRVAIRHGRARGIEVERHGKLQTCEASTTILSAGAIASPQLLMLSGIGKAERLRSLGIEVRADLPGVGRNLRDHPHCLVSFRGPTLGSYGVAPPMEVALRYTADGSTDVNDMIIGPVWMAGDRAAIHRAGHPGADDGTAEYPATVGLQMAEGQGYLTVASSDPHRPPTIQFDYLTLEADRRRMREGVRLTAELFRSPELSGIVKARMEPADDVLRSDDELDRWLLSAIGTQHHSSGTARMGLEDNPLAVVDQDCRVFGIDGLRVVDASVMPNVVRANTNLTTIMIAERIAAELVV
jgi:choline dehydrogenase